MPRKPRIEFAGAFYHVISRGNNRQLIFNNEQDYWEFKESLKITKNRYPFYLHAYKQMPNHFHLLVETKQVPLSIIMRSLLTRYARYFNRKYKRVGHVFQSRYKAILCEKNAYLLELVRYIHLNAVRAKLVKSPSDWEWSSHREYLGKSKNFIIDGNEVLRQFGSNILTARKNYSEFIREGLGKYSSFSEELYPPETFPYLGNEKFIEDMSKKYGELRRREWTKIRITLSELLKKISQVASISVVEIKGLSRKRNISFIRSIFSYIAVFYAGYKTKDVAEFLNCSSSAITLHLRSLKEQLKDDKGIQDIIDKVTKT